jgi:hypothetical protein
LCGPVLSSSYDNVDSGKKLFDHIQALNPLTSKIDCHSYNETPQ